MKPSPEDKMTKGCDYYVSLSAESQLATVVSYYRETDSTKGLQAAEQLIAEYPAKGCTKLFVGWAHFYAARFLEKMGRPQDAFSHYEQIISIHKSLPFKAKEMDIVRLAAVQLAKMGKVWTSGPFD